MKRSEMVIHIFYLLGNTQPMGVTNTVANQILDSMENLGMLPPETTVKSVMPGVEDFKVREWEPE